MENKIEENYSPEFYEATGEEAFDILYKSDKMTEIAWINSTTWRQGLICNRKKLTEFLNLFGIPFTYDTANILTTNTDDFTDGYKPSGQPENPTGGGDGAGDNNSDEMVFPTVHITPTNVFSRLSCCTTAELNKLSNFIFTATFFDNIKLLTNEPLEALCNVMYLPFDIHGHSNCSDIHTLTLMNVETPANVYDLSPNYNMVLNMGSISCLLPLVFALLNLLKSMAQPSQS